MFDGIFQMFLQRIAVDYTSWLDLMAPFRLAGRYSPVRDFVLCDITTVKGAIDALACEDRSLAIVSESRSTRPVHDGYLTRLHLKPTTGANGAETRTALDEWVQREYARDYEIERELREMYGRDEKYRGHSVFDLMDYPGFDQGSAGIAFGMLVDNNEDNCFLWSRITFAHK